MHGKNYAKKIKKDKPNESPSEGKSQQNHSRFAWENPHKADTKKKNDRPIKIAKDTEPTNQTTSPHQKTPTKIHPLQHIPTTRRETHTENSRTLLISHFCSNTRLFTQTQNTIKKKQTNRPITSNQTNRKPTQLKSQQQKTHPIPTHKHHQPSRPIITNLLRWTTKHQPRSRSASCSPAGRSRCPDRYTRNGTQR